MKSFLTSRRGRLAVSVGIYGVLALFLYRYLRSLDFSTLDDTAFSWWFLLAAFPFSVVSRVFLPYIWIKLIGTYQQIDSSNIYWNLNYVYAKSWLGKYIPGKVAWVAGKVYFALGLGIGKTLLGITSVLDTILQLLTALILGVVFLLVSGAYSNFSDAYLVFFFAATIVGLLCIYPPILNNLLSRAYLLLKKKPLEAAYFLKSRDLLRIAPMYLVIHSLSSLPIYFLIRSVGFDLSLLDVIYVAGAFVFAGAVGTLAFFAPSGIGVREGIILLFLTNVLPPEISVVIVLLLRVWSVVLDLLYWVLSLGMLKLFGAEASSGAGMESTQLS